MNDWTVVYRYEKPYGIRNRNGYVLFFSDVVHFRGQDERYEREFEEQRVLVSVILDALRSKLPQRGK